MPREEHTLDLAALHGRFDRLGHVALHAIALGSARLLCREALHKARAPSEALGLLDLGQQLQPFRMHFAWRPHTYQSHDGPPAAAQSPSPKHKARAITSQDEMLIYEFSSKLSAVGGSKLL